MTIATVTLDLNRQSMAAVQAMRDDIGVVSAYIDLSVPPGAAGADQWRIELRNRVKDLRERVRAYGSRDYAAAVDGALAHLESVAKSSVDPALEGSRGLGVFYGLGSSERIEVGSRARVSNAVVIRDRAYLPPLLVAVGELAPFGLVGLHRNEARVIGSSSTGGEELTSFRLNPDTSDWRQMSWPTASGKGSAQQSGSLRDNFEERLFATVRKSLGRLAKQMGELALDAGWDVLVVFGDPRLVGEFEAAFAPRGVETSIVASDLVWEDDLTVERILRLGKPIVDEVRKQRESDLADEMAGVASAGGRAVIGIEATVKALGSNRVQTLLFDSSQIEEPEPLAGGDRSKSVEQVVQMAFESDVDVLAVSAVPALESEKIAATLRW
ncbi:MAG: VLRF1 family aeRF1-type release factor [Actinomycetota bacterium]